MHRGRPPSSPVCHACGSRLEPLDPVDLAHIRFHCPSCGTTYRTRKPADAPPPPEPPTVSGLDLAARGVLLQALAFAYLLGTSLIATVLFVGGGFVLVLRDWLLSEGQSRPRLIAALGGIRVETESRDPDSDFGPLLRRTDAPRLFEELTEVARRLGVRPPEQVRLAFLPCCGVVAWRRSRALLLGMPLLGVLSRGELRAVLAHELAHLARGDATRAASSIRFVEGLSQALDDPNGKSWGPLRLWARVCRGVGLALVGPIARGQEARADRAAAGLAGGSAAASALVKVALVQPIFRELLSHDPGVPGLDRNIYATFRQLWARLPDRLLAEMRIQLLTRTSSRGDSPHPPLAERVARAQAYPDSNELAVDNSSALALLGDPEWLEQMLQDRLYGLAPIEPSVFHRAGT
jgi:Zn-dependent protease with chaperone function/predicted RNA-binding Zn-ribbon protein involved in translation (DUF1610 family)